MKCFSLQTLGKPSWLSTHLSVDAQPGFICAPSYSDIIGHEGQTPVKVILSGPCCSRVHTSSQQWQTSSGNTPGVCTTARQPLLPVAHPRCLHSGWRSPASESPPPWGSSHLSWWRFDWITKETEGNHTWALAGLCNNDFRLQCDSCVVVTGARSETTEPTFAGAYHLKDHLCGSTLMQPSLLIEGFLLFHFFLLEKTHRKRSVYAQGIHGGEVRWERSSFLAEGRQHT